MKCCSRCASVKAITEFRADKGKLDGLRGECKTCANASSLAQYYRKKAGLRAVRKSHPAGRSARIIFSNAIRDGKVKRQPCWVCGNDAQGHHPDYSRPLDVVWLCPAHHAQAHALAGVEYVNES